MVSMKVINRAVLNSLIKRYKEAGRDCIFKVKRLDLPYDNYQVGKSCAKMLRRNPPLIERINGAKCSPIYKTRFGEFIEKIGKIPKEI